jgi:UDP-N-acetylglucosamine acyltransferase
LKVPRIDPTSRVADGAMIADDVEVGPYCTIGPKVELRAEARLLSHVNLSGATVIGERTVIHPFASLGTPPQSTGYRGGATRLVVGSDCRIREGVTINTGTEDGGEMTMVGDRCFLMANSHVGHDCHVGSDVTLANGALLGGHVTIANHVFIGGNTAVHQFVRVGEGAMLGGVSGITRDTIPFGFAFGPKAVLVGLNIVGLKRRGFTRDVIHRLRRAYRMLFMASGTFAERVSRVSAEFPGDPAIGKIISFIHDGGSRPLMIPAATRDPTDSNTAP